MIELLIWWLVLAIVAIWLGTQKGSESPLLLAYFFSLSMIHAPGALNYTGRSVQLYHERETYVGFQLTLIGMTVLLSVVGVARILNLANASKPIESVAALSMQTVYRIIVVGAMTYFILTPLASLLPSGTAISAPLAGLLPLGFWFWVANAAKSDQPWPELGRIVLATLLLPVATVLVSGFLGFGVGLALSVMVMVLVVWPTKLPLMAVMPLLAYLGLSLGASYFLQRNEIRSAVWGGEDYSTRIDATLGIFRDFRFYDVNDSETVSVIEGRLNQNMLIGIGLQAHANGFSQLQYGATVPLWSLVPRALWPDKPQVGGGGSVVSDFTGITFSAGTSVGAGNPFEFYINFGWPGVVAGFLLLGILFAWHDRNLFAGLQRNDLRAVILYGLPGLTLLNPGGNLMEIMTSYVAAQFVARGFLVALGSPFVARVLGFNSVVNPLASSAVAPSFSRVRR
jgi:hypothetical protein